MKWPRTLYFHLPPRVPQFSLKVRNNYPDNAVMIAWTGLDRLSRGRVDPFEITTRPKWAIQDCEIDFENDDPS
jgi:tRNA A37 threonylcarbamoyltransferase TsaD